MKNLKDLQKATKELELSNFHLKKIVKERLMKKGFSEEGSEKKIEEAMEKGRKDMEGWA